MRFAVIGDRGMLGSEMSLLLKNQGEQVQGFNRSNLQLSSSPKELAAIISAADVLVNCVAYTNVDGAEKDWGLADLVNGYIMEGWQPFGSVAQVEGEYGIREYCQTMVIYEHKI
jgi:dTDP-4-dehydrorhamnose reductase